MTLQKLADLIEGLAQATAREFERVHTKIDTFQEFTNQNFLKIRQDILEIKDTYATKKELSAVTMRVEKLEKKK